MYVVALSTETRVYACMVTRIRAHIRFERQRDRETERQRDRETERQRKKEKEKESVRSRVLLFGSSITYIDACLSHPCANGGTCVLEDGNTFECKCQSHNRGPTKVQNSFFRGNEAGHSCYLFSVLSIFCYFIPP